MHYAGFLQSLAEWVSVYARCRNPPTDLCKNSRARFTLNYSEQPVRHIFVASIGTDYVTTSRYVFADQGQEGTVAPRVLGS